MPGRFLKYWLPVVVWMTMIFSASTGLGREQNTSRFLRPFLHWISPNMSDETFEKIHYAVRKTGHFVEYAILGLLLWRLIYCDPQWTRGKAWSFPLALLLAALYSASDEFHQSFVPGREARVQDVALDTCGAGAGLAALWTVRRLCRKK